MAFLTILLLAAGLAMDAFAVSVCKGLALGRATNKSCTVVGLWFGGFQAAMPLIGYFVGMLFMEYIDKFDHWIAFILLVLIGANMIKEAFGNDDEKSDASLAFKTMLIMAIATSIDALATGIAIACDPTINIYIAVVAIGLVTFALSFAGVKIGSIFGTKYKQKAELAGGIILILLGVKMLLDGYGII